MGSFRLRQGQRCPRGGLFRKHLLTTPKEQTDDSPQGQEHLTAHTCTHTHARTPMHTASERICDCKLRRNLENNLPTSAHTHPQTNDLTACIFERHTHARTHTHTHTHV